MALGDPTFWIATAITVVTNAATITYFVTRVKDKTEYQERDLAKLDRNVNDDIKEVADKLSNLLVTIEGFTREQSIMNQMNMKLTDSLTNKVEALQKQQIEHQSSLTWIAQIMKKRGLIE